MGELAANTEAPVAPRRRVGFYLLLLFILLAGLTFAALEWRRHSVNSQVQAALVGETGAETVAYRRDLIGGNDLVFDVRTARTDISMADMTRLLLKSAEALKGQQFHRVYLAYKGNEKFYFDGAYFQQIGETRLTENPVYTARTMPENVHNLDGSPAFETWSGGLLGVVGAQMDDFQQFHLKWWGNDALAEPIQ